MDLPDKVQVGAYSIDIEVNPKKLLDEGNDRGEVIAGLATLEEQLITLGEYPDDYTADSLLHEILHICLRVSSCNINDEVAKDNVYDVEERIVSALTGILLDTLRRNPQLIRYLLKRR